MGVKKRTKTNDLVKELANRDYGGYSDAAVQVSISMPKSLQIQLSDLAYNNKRAGEDLTTVSAIVRDALDWYFDNY